MLFYSSQFPFSVSPVVWVLPFVDAKSDIFDKWTSRYIYKKNIPRFCTFITSVYKAERNSQNSSCHMSTAQHLPANKTSGLPASLQTWTAWPETNGSEIQTCYFRRFCRSNSSWLQKGHQQSDTLFYLSFYSFCSAFW